MPYIEIRRPLDNKLLFKFDPIRRLIEHVDRNIKTVVDLTQYEPPQSAKESDDETATDHSS